MRDSTKLMLKRITDFVSDYNEYINEEVHIRHKKLFREEFNKLKSRNQIIEFYKDIKHEFINESETFIFLLSIIYKITNDENCLIEAMETLCEGKIDLYTSINIRNQVEMNIFKDVSLSRNYRMRRRIHKLLLSRFEEQLGTNFSYMPADNRNENRIVIITNYYLSDLHGTTRVTKEICKLLQDNLGKEVLLVIAVEGVDVDRLEEVWFEPDVRNYLEKYNGNFYADCFGCKVPAYQVIVSEDNINEIRQITQDIYNFNPSFVWYMGNLTVYADIFRKFTTVMAMPFTDGYVISEAPIMCTYLNSHSDEIKDMEAYFAETNQVPIQYNLRLPVKSSTCKYKRSEFNINEEDFLIAVVGNRLDIEVTDEFILLINRIIEIDSRISIVFIGIFESYPKICKNKNLINRTYYLGYQNDLVGVLEIMNLFLNPPRQGGATGAIYSMSNGVPVVTLGNCDVANNLSSEDICSNEKEMIDLVKRYFCDKTFYKNQSVKMKSMIDSRGLEQLIYNTEELLSDVIKIINHKE